MARKFLGEKIDPSIDAIRPASMTLTVEDLMNIPIFTEESNDEEQNTFNNSEIGSLNTQGKRLSRKFGGTINLKKRLESVPEVFMYNFRRNSLNNKKNPKNKSQNIVKTPTTNLRTNTNCNEPRPKNLNSKRVLQRRISERNYLQVPKLPNATNSIDQKMADNNICNNKPYNETYNSKKVLKNVDMNNSTALFDEIIEYYGSSHKGNSSVSLLQHDSHTRNNINSSNKATNVFNSELERVMNHVTKADNINRMRKEEKADIENDKYIMHHQTHQGLKTPTQLNSKFSSPAYSDLNQTSPWSSLGEDFSDVATLPASILHSTSTYITSREDWESVDDLSINKIPSRTTESIHQLEKVSNSVSPLIKLKHIQIIPQVANMNYDAEEDEESDDESEADHETIRNLQDKIDCISISTTKITVNPRNPSRIPMSSTSSIYSSV